jgi:hypothetical protein
MGLVALSVAGCGYTTQSLLAPHVKTVYIDNFRSSIDITRETAYGDHYRIYRPGLERDLTKEVKDRFVFDGNVRVVNRKEEADSFLTGEIIDLRKEPLQYTDNRAVDEYRVKLIINMKFTDLTTDTVLFDEKNVAGEDSYTLSGAFTGSESTTIQGAIEDLARRIVEKVIEGW